MRHPHGFHQEVSHDEDDEDDEIHDCTTIIVTVLQAIPLLDPWTAKVSI